MEHLPPHIRNFQCDYCAKPLPEERWHSEWGDTDLQHYKALPCSSCGRKNWFTVRFFGSGHDHHVSRHLTELDSIEKIVKQE